MTNNTNALLDDFTNQELYQALSSGRHTHLHQPDETISATVLMFFDSNDDPVGRLMVTSLHGITFFVFEYYLDAGSSSWSESLVRSAEYLGWHWREFDDAIRFQKPILSNISTTHLATETMHLLSSLNVHTDCFADLVQLTEESSTAAMRSHI